MSSFPAMITSCTEYKICAREEAILTRLDETLLVSNQSAQGGGILFHDSKSL
jgi:hypothetical protein